MADVFSKEKRSEIMSKIRGKNTKIELIVFRDLRKRGVYFQKHYKGVVGKPDIALPRKKIAIFIDGDFWHGYNYAKTKKRLPKVYWRAKIEANITRDVKNRRKLQRMGWKVLRVWEHNLARQFDKSIQQIVDLLVR